MFTGLIEEVGTVVAMRASDGGARLQIAAPRTAKVATSGDSIAVNGCCLTLTSRRGDRLLKGEPRDVRHRRRENRR